jgi:hypothetical protein
LTNNRDKPRTAGEKLLCINGPAKEAVATRFYAHLFGLGPALRALFRSDMREQQSKVVQM